MLEAFTISSNSRFHTLVILTEKKSARASTLEFGILSLNDFPRVIVTLLIVKNRLRVYQQNDVVFYSTLASPLVDGGGLNVHYLM